MTVVRWPLFGELLEGYRNRQRMSQNRLAEAASLTVSHISRMERGLRKPSRETCLRLAVILRLSEFEAELFLQVAGYSSGPASDLSHPLARDLDQVLLDPRLPRVRSQSLQQVVSGALELAHAGPRVVKGAA